MGTMRHGMGGMGGSRAERSPRAGGARGGADLAKKKPALKKVLPQVWALMAPRKGLILAGFGLMVVNRVAGLVMPFMTKPLMDKVLSTNGNAALLPKMIALVFGAMLVQAS